MMNFFLHKELGFRYVGKEIFIKTNRLKFRIESSKALPSPNVQILDCTTIKPCGKECARALCVEQLLLSLAARKNGKFCLYYGL